MRSAIFPLSSNRQDDAPLGRRAVAFVLVLLVHLLIGVLLFTLAPRLHKPDDKPDMQAFEISAVPAPKPAATKHAAPKAAPTPRPVQPKPVVPPKPLQFGLQLAEPLDISKLPNHKGEQTADGSADSGQDSASTYGPGEGPGGQTLFNAEWYREPRHAEIAGYLPPTGAPLNSWAIIACRTVPDNRIEDCQELGESPPGSRLAGAIRQAAWQFRVRPPRVNGKAMIGAWVRIRFDFTENGEK